MRIGLLEYLIILVIILLRFIPLAVVAILVRNYMWKRRVKQSEELQAEIVLLRQQVAELEGNAGMRRHDPEDLKGGEL